TTVDAPATILIGVPLAIAADNAETAIVVAAAFVALVVVTVTSSGRVGFASASKEFGIRPKRIRVLTPIIKFWLAIRFSS
ncbi:MAG: hypothetical protein ACKPA7_00910, partial [Sphaerospermopsis kisseleviana]